MSLTIRPIGVFDSGIGGLSILKALRAELPAHDFIYLADAKHAPYGERDAAYVVARSRKVAAYLVSQNISALVMACNTATAAAVHVLRAEYPSLALVGVEPALKPAITISKTKRIGIMATRGTLASAKFQKLLDSHFGSAEFVLQACDGLADAIERGFDTGSDEATAKIAANCAHQTQAMGDFGMNEGQIDTLVLGCTHYPFVTAQLRQLVGPSVHLLDPGEAVARQTRRLLLAEPGHQPGTGRGHVKLLTTGTAKPLQAAAHQWLGLSEKVQVLEI